MRFQGRNSTQDKLFVWKNTMICSSILNNKENKKISYLQNTCSISLVIKGIHESHTSVMQCKI